MNLFLKKLMDAAQNAGITACEAFIVQRDSFSAMVTEGEVTEYKSNATRGLGFRGLKDGKMGYSSTEAFDDEAVAQLVSGVVESAELSEDTDPAFFYSENEEAPQLDLCSDELKEVTPERKIECVKLLEKQIREYDERIVKAARNVIQTGRHTIRIVNSYGMDRSFTEDMCIMYGMAMAKEGESVATGFYGDGGRSFSALDAAKIGAEAGRRAVTGLNASQVPSGQYRIVFSNEAMADLLQTFCGIISAENAQKGLSLLKGKLGEKVAADCVTLIDDPLLLDGLEARPFDAEGVPSKVHTVIENGVFRTFLHNLKTAHKDNVETTGNASKSGYASAVHVAPSNLYFKAGTRTLDEMLHSIGEGIVITEVSGLHAGANPVSGDFSLLSKGYTFVNGKRDQTVEQITVAGNFYELLSNMREFSSNLLFPLGGIGSPDADVGELSISGR